MNAQAKREAYARAHMRGEQLTASQSRQVRRHFRGTQTAWRLHGYQVKQWERVKGGKKLISPPPARGDVRQTTMRQDTLWRACKAILG